MTRQRKTILEIIKTSNEHMTAEEIYLKAKKVMPSIAMGTVYRNLGLMTEAGEIRRIPIPDSPDRYDKSVKPHEHMVCQECGEVHDVFIDGLLEYLRQSTGAEITGYDLNLRFICENCRRKDTIQGHR